MHPVVVDADLPRALEVLGAADVVEDADAGRAQGVEGQRHRAIVVVGGAKAIARSARTMALFAGRACRRRKRAAYTTPVWRPGGRASTSSVACCIVR